MAINKRVLITCVGGDAILPLLLDMKKDKQLNLSLIGVDLRPVDRALPLLDGFYQVAHGDENCYVNQILDIATRENVDIIVPFSDEEAFSLSCSRDQFDTYNIDILVSPNIVLDMIRDKQRVYVLLENLGIRTALRTTVNTKEQLIKALRESEFPEKSVVVKPSSGRGGRGVRLLCGGDSPPQWVGSGKREVRLDKVPKNVDDWFKYGPLMVMPLLNDPVYDVDIFAVQGEVVHYLARRRHNPVGIPYTGNDIVMDPEIKEYCAQITRALQLDGLHDIDLMTGNDGMPYLLEINPRPSGSIAAAHNVGYRLVTAAIAKRLNIDYEIKAITKEKRVEFSMVSKKFVNGK